MDDPDDIEAQKQKPIAEAILSNPCFVPLTVILEFEWVMRGFYKFPKIQIIEIYTVLFKYTHIDIEDKLAVIKAVKLYEQGLDFADALHLSYSLGYKNFVTFDHKFYQRAKSLEFNIELAGD